MCKIIQFPKSRINHTNGYKNLVALFEVCDSVESCNFYLEAVEDLWNNENITENELFTLRRIGRQKRIKLATPQQEPQKADKPGAYTYTPEMGQEKPKGCQIEASLAFYGKHYFIDTPLELKGRGITFIKKYSSNDLTESGKYKAGWNEYRITTRAFEKLKSQYAISYESCLD